MTPTLVIPTEHEEQVIVIKWLNWNGVPYFAVPNAAKRGPRLAAYLKAEGMQAGVPDLILPVHRVAIEMKRRNAKPSDTSAEQLAWHARLRAGGWQVRVCFGAREAIDWLRELGVGTVAGVNT